MKVVKEPAPIICERCEKVFKAKYAFYCPKCVNEMRSQRAKRIGLNMLGANARWRKESEDTE